MKFSEIVKKIRGVAGLTQVAFAAKLGVCTILISHYETGYKKYPKISVAKKLIKIAKGHNYNVTMDDIYL